MKPVVSPLHSGDQGVQVTNLQQGLTLLLNRQVIQTDPATREQLLHALADEAQGQVYKSATAKSVGIFQDQHHLPVTEAVDAPTAEALNASLRALGAFDSAQESQKRVVAGQVLQDDRTPFKGTVVLSQEGDQGSIRLGEDVTDPEGRYTIGYDSALGLDGARLHIAAFDPDGNQRAEATVAATQPVEIVNLTASREAPVHRVQGSVASPSRAGVGGLRVQIVDKNAGPDVPLVETSTAADGSYRASFSYAGSKDKPDLQARVLSGDKFLGASEVRYNASNAETLPVFLSEDANAALASEYETLTGAVKLYFTGNLRDLQENDERQDITYLANKTGWDARAVALAALADQFSTHAVGANGAPAIPPPFFYALFRAGLPTNEDTLYYVDAKSLEAVWQTAVEQGVIPQASADQIPNLIGRFQTVSAQKLLTAPSIVGVSSLQEMLTVSGLGDAQQATFARLYAANSTDMPTFWKSVSDALGPDTAKRLQVDGKLEFLTLNNASLTKSLQAAVGGSGIADPLQLAQMGYYRPEKWSALLAAGAPIPKEIPGDTPEAKQANYASYLAAQVRLSYPTAAVAQMVKSGELPLTGAAPGISDQVHAFLTAHQSDFEIGAQPVQQYIAQNKLQVADEIVQQIKRVQRVYQITASDQAMAGLMKRGMDAASRIVRYDKATFVQSFAADVGGPDQAARTYDRSVQVHNTVLNVAVNYLKARTSLAIGVHNATNILDPAPANASDVVAYARLENLFGSMDFCTCDHCRSILSPAAYLVDVLLFLSSDADVWADNLNTWKKNHANAPYPFVDQNDLQKFQQQWNKDHPGQPLPNTEISPFDVLMSRRPDIQHLPLTCENTNTALPYIDMVNETLEYYIANGLTLGQNSLAEYQGHDTNDIASEDLLASPQFVMDSTYAKLRNERFPNPLPFHQPLENLRRYFAKFQVPLPLAMERFREGNDLERGASPYGWRDILMEELGLSRAEYEILTDAPNAVSLSQMYGFPDGTADAAVIADLSNAKQFTRRVGITDEDLDAILKTQFVNPNSDLIPKLEKLSVPFATLKALKDGTLADADWDKLMAALAVPPDPSAYGNDIKGWVKNDANYARIMGLITLALPSSTWAASEAYTAGDCVLPSAVPPGSTLYYECKTAGTSGPAEPKWPTTPGQDSDPDGTVVWTCQDATSCSSFDSSAFRYSDPAKLTQNLSAVEFIRLLRFIRLWKKLGWTIEQTDAALCALYRQDLAPVEANDLGDLGKLDAGFRTLLPRLGIVVRVLKELELTRDRDLLPLLVCWSEIGTHGDSALYRQMFLNPTILQQDPVFGDHGYGEFLADATKKLADHAEALRSAFNLTGDEYGQIITALGYDANTALTLATIGEIFRRGWLARKLKLSVRELLLLIQLTGLDPFAAPDVATQPAPPAPSVPAEPLILRLIALVQALRDRSFKSAAALYLIWNQDLSGKSAPDPTQIATFARTLRLSFAAVAADFAVDDDPDGSIAAAQLAKVYGSDAAAFFFGLINATLTVEVAFVDPDGTMAPGPMRQAIEAAAGKTDTNLPAIAYDDFRKRLSYSGVLTTTKRDAIKTAAGAGAGTFNAAVDQLYNQNQAVINPFFARYPELQASLDAYISDAVHTAAQKRSDLLKAILPDLVQRQKQQQALQSVSAVAKTDLAFTQALLDAPAAPFPLHAVGHADQAALNDLLALETPGLSARFFANDTANGAIIPAQGVAANLDYAPVANGASNPLPANPTAGAAISGIWSGYIEAPENGFFNLLIETDAGTTVTLTLDGTPVEPVQNATPWKNKNPVEWRAGTLHSMVLTVEKVRQVVRVQWEWEPKGQGRTVIPARYLYPADLFERFQQTLVRFLKVASLAAGLGLTANELSFSATHLDNAIGGDGWLNVLPASGDAPNPDKLLKPFQALLDFGRIKADLLAGDESLLTVLKDPAAATKNTDSLLFAVTRWDPTSLNDVLAQFGGNIASLGHFDQFRRVYDAFALIQMMGIRAQALIQATTNDPAADTVSNLQAALRARYDPADWRGVVQPINNEMRGLQRDALVAYILHQMLSHPDSAWIDTPDKLFEYFLMDVQMDPCMQTSRIRHALSSVQLFIERCLMNLEPRVSPAAINADQWQWMKRYRIWEANRKVYLFPENWLEPELRDDKSPFFKEIESELLQSDITEDSAATALLNYLVKLEEVAKLEPCGIYHIPHDDGQKTREINHVVARTAGAHRKYYYRRQEDGSWMPWEQVKLDIEDNPVIPVVWNNRLFLFWLRILKQGPDTAQKPPAGKHATDLMTDDLPSDPQLTVQAVLCWSEYYNGKWQTVKTSDMNNPISLSTFAPGGPGSPFFHYHTMLQESGVAGHASAAFHPYPQGGSASAFDRSTLRLESDEPQPGQLRIAIYGNFTPQPRAFLLYNTHSLPVPSTAAGTSAVGNTRSLEGPATLTIKYDGASGKPHSRDVIRDDLAVSTVQPNNGTSDLADAPFFLEDSRNVFFVTSEEQEMYIPDHFGYGVPFRPGSQIPHVPPLVVRPMPHLPPKFWRDGGPIGPDPGIIDPAPMERFVSEDAYIRQGLGTTEAITYGDRAIGPSGAVANGHAGGA